MTTAAAAPSREAQRFRAARDLLLECRGSYEQAYERFRWPELDRFNWALDWFDQVATRAGERTALRILESDGEESSHSYAELSRRSNRAANFLRAQGVRRGDRVLAMLGGQVELWEVLLACMKLGAVLVPAATLLGVDDLHDRVERGQLTHVVVKDSEAGKFARIPGTYGRIVASAAGAAGPGWVALGESAGASPLFEPDGHTNAGDPMLLYFTSGTTAKPKLVLHTHRSYPVGHLSTMYWIGLQPDDVHLNVASPGWAKHAWSSVFAPWNAEATVLVHNSPRFDAPALLDEIVRCATTTMCAPPTVWRMLIQQDLGRWPVTLREAVAAGEPLNPEVIDAVERAWSVTVRDGYGQTETTAQIGNPPGATLKPGSMGRPLPGYRIELVDPSSGEIVAGGRDGEITIPLAPAPAGLMARYEDGESRATTDAMRDGRYHTGDVARRDDDGYVTYVGRADDVFKCSGYRISPFELESVLLEHPAVAEAAVIPSPEPLLLAVPKAVVVLAAGWEPTPDTARDVLAFARGRLSPYKRVRRIEFGELPKTISGKIRRSELRLAEQARRSGGERTRGSEEFFEEDLFS